MWRVVESWFVKIANKLQKEKGIVYNYVYLLYIYHIVIIISILVIRFAIKFHIFIICPNLWWYSKKYLNIFHIKESNIYIYTHIKQRAMEPAVHRSPVLPVPPLFDALHCRAPSSHPVARSHPSQWHENTMGRYSKCLYRYTNMLTCVWKNRPT